MSRFAQYSMGVMVVLMELLLARPDVRAQPADSLAPALQQVDAWSEDGQFQQALERLQTLKSEYPDNAEVLWRLSRTKVDIGEQLADTDEDRMEELYQDALTDAQEAVAADSMNANAHLAIAISAGRVGLISGTREKVRKSRMVKDHVDRAIELDSTLSAAYHVRGRWNYEVADLGFFARTIVKVVYGGLPDASFEAAVRNFKKSIELDDRVVDHLELGRTYLKLDQEERARQEFQTALKLPNKDPDDPEYKKEARKLLEEVD